MEQPRVIAASQRPDGTWRKEIRVRPGYVSGEEIKKYVPPHQRKKGALDSMKKHSSEQKTRDATKGQRDNFEQRKHPLRAKIESEGREDSLQRQEKQDTLVCDLAEHIEKVHLNSSHDEAEEIRLRIKLLDEDIDKKLCEKKTLEARLSDLLKKENDNQRKTT